MDRGAHPAQDQKRPTSRGGSEPTPAQARRAAPLRAGDGWLGRERTGESPGVDGAPRGPSRVGSGGVVEGPETGVRGGGATSLVRGGDGAPAGYRTAADADVG